MAGFERQLQDLTNFIKAEARIARRRAARFALAEDAKEVRFPLPVGKELSVHLGVVEPGHRPGIEPERARRKDEIASLQGGIAEGRGLGVLWRGLVPTPRRRVVIH